MAIPYDWRYRVLNDLRAPASTINITALTKWAASEGTPTAWNNWLATTMDANGAVPVNSSGVKQYPNLDVGALATARTIELSAYKAVLAALRAGNNMTNIYRAVNASPWCSNCQSGHYPSVLFTYLVQTGAGQAAPTQPEATNTPSQPSDIDWPAHLTRAGSALGDTAGSLGNGLKALDRAIKARSPKPWKPS